jgi:hypothetical protein
LENFGVIASNSGSNNSSDEQRERCRRSGNPATTWLIPFGELRIGAGDAGGVRMLTSQPLASATDLS